MTIPEDGKEYPNMVILTDGETWDGIPGCLIVVNGKVYNLESVVSFGIPLTQPEPLTAYVDVCTNEAVVEREP